MKDGDVLHELVHALGKNEKRYFKMYCTGISGRESSNYLQLFSALEKQKTYDAAALKRSLSPSLVKNLSSEKNYLFNLIMDSLLVFHREQPAQRVRMLLNKAQLLFDKGLVRSSSKLLISAKKLARQYDNKGLLLDIISLQGKLVVHLRDVDVMKQYVEEKEALAQEIINENRYTGLLSRVVGFSLDTTYMRDPVQRAAFDRIMEDELLQDESRAISLQAKLLFHNIWSFYYYLVKMEGHLLDSNRRMLQLFRENPGHTSLNLNDYLSVLSNFVADALANGKKEDVTGAMTLLEEFPETYRQHISPVVHENYRHLYFESVAKINAWLGEFGKIISLLPEMKMLVTGDRVLKPHRRQSVAFNTALALFARKRYKEALRLLHEVEDIHEAGSGSYVYFMQAMFLRIMTHYELGNIDVLDEHVSWLRQFLAKQHKLHRTEDELLAFFAKLPDAVSPKKRRELFRKEYEKIEVLLKDAYENPFLRTLAFTCNWIRANAEQIDFTEATKKVLGIRH